MLPIKIDVSRKLPELAVGCSQELMHAKSDCGTRCVKFESFVRNSGVRQRCENKGEPAKSNRQFHRSFSFPCCVASLDASVFKSGVRDNGNFPNKLPSAKAGSPLSNLASCTPVMRAISVSKCATARKFGSWASR